MLLSSVLLALLCGWTVKAQTTSAYYRVWTTRRTITYLPTTEVKLSNVYMYEMTKRTVLAVESIVLKCHANPSPPSVHWSWQRLEGYSWQKVGSSRDLNLTRPEQSGTYRCIAHTRSQTRESMEWTVRILSPHPTEGDRFGVPAFVIALIALIIIIVAILSLLVFQRLCGTWTITGSTTRAFPEPDKTPKGGLAPTNSDADVYMNYTNTKPAYSNLDPAQMSADNVYASLS